MFEHPPAGCWPVLQPGSPGMADVRAYGSLTSRMEADAKLLSGSKRSCEGDTSLQDEAEADEASMVSVAAVFLHLGWGVVQGQGWCWRWWLVVGLCLTEPAREQLLWRAGPQMFVGSCGVPPP